MTSACTWARVTQPSRHIFLHVCTQWCKFMSKNLKVPLESRADGEGKLARRRNIKSASFHTRSDSEIYTTE